MMPPGTGRLRRGRAVPCETCETYETYETLLDGSTLQHDQLTATSAVRLQADGEPLAEASPQRMVAVDSIEALSETSGPCGTWTSLLSSRSSAEMSPSTMAKDTASRGNVQGRGDPFSEPW